MSRLSRMLRWLSELIERPSVVESPYRVTAGWFVIQPVGTMYTVSVADHPEIKPIRMTYQQLFWLLSAGFELMNRVERTAKGNQ